MHVEYLAVLDKEPKVAGHTLIISTKVDPKHYRDITELPKDEIGILEGVRHWARQIKKKLEEFGVKKVYVLSMCDHWTDEELCDRCTHHHTEHLHFHLIPRWDFDKDIRGEEVLLRRGRKGFEKIPGGCEKMYDLLKDC